MKTTLVLKRLFIFTISLALIMGLATTARAGPDPGKHIQIPRIDLDNDWETLIQVQNVGDADTGAIFLGWGDYSELCPPIDPGVITHYCQPIQENAVWTLKNQLDQNIKSGIIYTVPIDVFQEACTAAGDTVGDSSAWSCWVQEWESGNCESTGGNWAEPPGAKGEDVAVTAFRQGPDPDDYTVASVYEGISEKMDRPSDGAPPYEYYVPRVERDLNGLTTELTIQNSGDGCTSVWIDYMEKPSCSIIYKQHIEQLAPGESIRVDLPGPLPPSFILSAHITADQPLGIVVDVLGQGTLSTYIGKLKAYTEYEDTKYYADGIYRESSGWSTSIDVMDLSTTGQDTYTAVDFMDNSGDEIKYLSDWVCPGGARTFTLPSNQITSDFDYIGAVEIQSHNQIGFPEPITYAQPIAAVVTQEKDKMYDDISAGWRETAPGETQAVAYNAHGFSQKLNTVELAIPFVVKGYEQFGMTSKIFLRNNANCNKIKFEIHFYDETGREVAIIKNIWLHPKHGKLIDLHDIGALPPGFIGAAVAEVTAMEELCNNVDETEPPASAVMPSAVVFVDGGDNPIDGDWTGAFSAFPTTKGYFAGDGYMIGPGWWYNAGYKVTSADTTIVAEVAKGVGPYDPPQWMPVGVDPPPWLEPLP